MQFYEFEVKRVLAKHGIAVPRGKVAQSAAEAEGIAAELGGPVAVKAQLFARGRSDAGGVKLAKTPAEAKAAAAELLALSIKDQKASSVLVEEQVAAAKLYSLQATYDGTARRPVFMASDQGGKDMDDLGEQGKLQRRHFSALTPLTGYQAKELTKQLGLGGRELLQLTGLVHKLGDLFLRYDFTFCEINALAQKADGSFVALDAHAALEAEALPRQTALLSELAITDAESRGVRPPTAFERAAAEIDADDPRGIISPVAEFDGNMGLVIGAGGGSITTFDAITRYGGKPANYCAIGGNPSVRKAERLTKLVLSKSGVEKICVISNVVSNTRADLVARGVIKGVKALGFEPKDKITIFRVPGAWEADAFKILEKYGIEYCDRTVSLSEAARRAVEKAKA